MDQPSGPDDTPQWVTDFQAWLEQARAWLVEYWQFSVSLAAAILLALIGIIVSIALSKPKKLSYKVVDDVRILSHYAKNVRNKLTLTYGATVVEDPRVVTLRIWNSGRQAIRPDDFDEPLRVRCSKSKPVDAEVVASNVKRLLKSSNQIIQGGADGRLTVRPGLLNPRDSFAIQLCTDGPPGEIAVTARVADESRPIRSTGLLPGWGLIIARLAFLVMGGTLATMAVLIVLEAATSEDLQASVGIGIFAGVLVGLTFMDRRLLKLLARMFE